MSKQALFGWKNIAQKDFEEPRRYNRQWAHYDRATYFTARHQRLPAKLAERSGKILLAMLWNLFDAGIANNSFYTLSARLGGGQRISGLGKNIC